MKTLAVNVEDLQKIIDAAQQIEALLELLPDGSPVVPLLKPIDGLLGKALYGPVWSCRSSNRSPGGQ